MLLQCLKRIGDTQGDQQKYNTAMKVAQNMLKDAGENSDIFRYAIRVLATASPLKNVSVLWAAIEKELCSDEKYKQLRSFTVKDIRGVDDATDMAKGVADALHKKDTPRIKNWAEISDEESNGAQSSLTKRKGIFSWCDPEDDEKPSRLEKKVKDTSSWFSASTSSDEKPKKFSLFGSSAGMDASKSFGFGSSTGPNASKSFGFGLSTGLDASQSFGFGLSGSDSRIRKPFGNSFQSSQESWKTRESDEGISFNSKAFFGNAGESANDNPFKSKLSTFSGSFGSEGRVQILDPEPTSTALEKRNPHMWTLEQREELVDSLASEVVGRIERRVTNTAKEAALTAVESKTAELHAEFTNALKQTTAELHADFTNAFKQNTAELKEALAEGFKSSSTASTKTKADWTKFGLLTAPEDYTEEQFFGSLPKVRPEYNAYKEGNAAAIHPLLGKLKAAEYPYSIVIGYAQKNPISPMGVFMLQLENDAAAKPRSRTPRAPAGATKKSKGGPTADGGDGADAEEEGSDHEHSEAARAAFNARLASATPAAKGDFNSLLAEDTLGTRPE